MRKKYIKILCWIPIIILWCGFSYYCFQIKMSKEVGFKTVGLSLIPMLSIALIYQVILIMRCYGNKKLQRKYTKYNFINGVFIVLCYSMILFFTFT